MIQVTDEGRVIYKIPMHWDLGRFPEAASDDVVTGPKGNFQIFDPLDFLAEVTQHIPGKGDHPIRYYGWYSNKNRGQRAQAQPAVAVAEPQESGAKLLAPGRKPARKRWAALIKQVYEIDPLSCHKCGAEMKTYPPVALAKGDHRFPSVPLCSNPSPRSTVEGRSETKCLSVVTTQR